jgi:hypothetical protein
MRMDFLKIGRMEFRAIGKKGLLAFTTSKMMNIIIQIRFGGSCLEPHCEATTFLEWDMVVTCTVKEMSHWQSIWSKERQFPSPHPKEREPIIQHKPFEKSMT